MGDDEAIELIVIRAYSMDDAQLLDICHIRAVYMIQLLNIDFYIITDLRKLLPQLGAAQSGDQPVR